MKGYYFRKGRSITGIFFLFLLYSFSPPSPEKIEFEKTGCLGNCKAYKISIDRKGHAEYEGIRNVRLTGKYTRKLNRKENKELWRWIHSARLDTLKEEYDYGAEDSQQRFLKYHSKGKVKEIRFGHDVPDILNKIDGKLENLIKNEDWIKE